MPAQPTGRLGLLRIPAPGANKVQMRFAPLAQRDKFAPTGWPVQGLASAQLAFPGWWEIDIDALALADGAYEYEFILDGHTDRPVADPFADEITRFGGYRGVFRISAGRRVNTTDFRCLGCREVFLSSCSVSVPGSVSVMALPG